MTVPDRYGLRRACGLSTITIHDAYTKHRVHGLMEAITRELGALEW
jgi:hypothetical protein